MLIGYEGKKPVLDPESVVMRGSWVVGDVRVGARTSVWFGATLRGDVAGIEIGECCSVQDNCVVHCDHGKNTTIGNFVTLGHGAILHAVQDGVLIGMNSTVLDGAVVGRGSVVAAGAVVTPGTVVPPFSLVAGVPGKVIRQMDESTFGDRVGHAERYYRLATAYEGEQER
jgi:carbonic anhydrase/acetyltransferase-like protein (isoleucine patch superfamily)